MRAHRRIPRFRLDVGEIMRTADGNRDLIGIDSELRGYGYVTDLEDALVVTQTDGYLRIRKDRLGTLIEELQWLNEDIERRSRD